MKLLYLSIIPLIFIGCANHNHINPKKKKIDSLEGHYIMSKGSILYSKEKNIKILKGDMIIEKLDTDDYGYYLVIKPNGFTIDIDDFGILHKKDNIFYKKLIYSKTANDKNIIIEEDKKNIVNLTLINNNRLKLKINLLSKKVLKGEWIKVNKPKGEKLKETEHEYKLTYRDRFLKYFKDN